MFRKTFSYHGKRYSVSGKTQEKLEENLARKRKKLVEESELVAGGYNLAIVREEALGNSSVTVEDWVSEWLTIYKRPVVSGDWYKGLSKFCTNLILPAVGKMKVSEVRPTDLQKILNTKSHCSKSYIKTIHNVICEIFSAARVNGLIDRDPSEAVVRPAGRKKKPRRSLTADERRVFLAAISGYWAELFLKFQLFCGLRPSEAAVILWSDIDLESGVISVNKALKADKSVGETKTASGVRKVPLPQSLIEDLRKYKRINGDGLVCHNSKGGPLTRDSIKVMWKQVLKRMERVRGREESVLCQSSDLVEEPLVMYCLRHTYCTDLQAAGVPINVARELMGHSSISVTAEIYTHSSPESFQDAREKINALAERREASVTYR